MNSFFNTLDTIDSSKVDGFRLFGPEHIAWLFLLVVTALVLSIIYSKGCDQGCGINCPRNPENRHLMEKEKKICRHGIKMILAILIIADEMLKYILVAVNNAPVLSNLPLQLCSICTILVVIHAFLRLQSKWSLYLGNFLYLIGIPAGLSALLFPAWSRLPAFNLMSIHSFSAHILFVSYIVMLIAAKEIKISAKTIPFSVSALCIMAFGIYLFNIKFNTNFMFLINISRGSPLAWFETIGDYRMGYVYILLALILVLYGGRALIIQIMSFFKCKKGKI